MHPSPETVFAALGDATRLTLIARLNDGNEHSITRLSEGLEHSRQGITKHLHVLQRAGVVACKRVGRETRYTIKTGPISHAHDYLTRVSSQWDEAATRLRDAVER